MDFLPISKSDMADRGIKQLDFVFVCGDAYVDHPSFGVAIITRLLEKHGFSVGVIAQPDWKNPDSIAALNQPRLGFLVSGGNMDSMVNHYTVSKKRREKDAYSPGGVMGLRPDHATNVYSNLIRRVYKNAAIILGGMEASLRRFAHYDYWSDSLKRSLLLDSGADILVYGMGEKSIVEIAEALNSGLKISDLTFIKGTTYKAKTLENVVNPLILPSFSALKADKKLYAKSFMSQMQNTSQVLAEQYDDFFVVQNPPQPPLSTVEMDAVYALDFMRDYHPIYREKGGIPAIEEVKFSITSARGCFGACNFCALSFHQGRAIQSRSHDSIIKEAELLTTFPDFKGYINDVGGPTANFRHSSCDKSGSGGACADKQCLFPTPCKNLRVSHEDYTKLLAKLRSIPKVKKVFVRSGVRFDYVLADSNGDFLKNLCEFHVSGQLKVAPEHVSDNVLFYMGKPQNSVYRKFSERFKKVNEGLGKKQYLVPYLMSSHPGSTLKDAINLAEYLRDNRLNPEQVQDFYPTPSTVSTCMFYTGIDPRSGKSVYIPANPHEKAMQRALIQYKNPKNRRLVIEALTKANRKDLIGFGSKCLVRPPERFHKN